ncbi:hypothetical protein [Paenibacillus qinlingensis]|uniref:Pectate lyase n=1 Tax=Paenibacillus qinlingensis TaxID=1837343 RepID=A0ABU1NRT8_9BACL|nr:hypothetical protein [Paenibacillus qinlingensis]MDR6550069.1 hypothetical protein [Paenibacillus qinlingensis]
MSKLRLAILFSLMFMTACFISSSAFALPVIPGAAGYGMDTPAGRGGTVYKVTSLADTNTPGTLRYAINRTGPRVIVFEVSGTINVNATLNINNPYITIAGQTAPSPGIFLRGAVVQILTHDVLLQHLRVAPGDDPIGVATTSRDALAINGLNGKAENIVIDHCTFTWSVDELWEAWNPYGNITFRHVIASQPLHDSIHIDEGDTEPAPHGFGPIYDNQPSSHSTVVGSLISHAEGRMPYVMASDYVQVNNVFYDRVNSFNRFDAQKDVVTRNSIVGNVFKNGPSLAAWAVGKKPIEINAGFASGGKVYLSDNVVQNHSFSLSTQWDLIQNSTSFTQAQLQAATPPAWNTGLVAKPVGEVVDWVLDNVGARPADRLPYENTIINNVRNGTGAIIDSIVEAGGWPVVQNNTRTLVLPTSPNADDDADGYTNLEEWLETYSAEVEGRAVSSTLFSNLTVNDATNAANWSTRTNLQTGDLTYGDRTTVFSAVSSSVAGSDWIKPAMDSKAYTGTTLVSFNVNQNSDVYVAHNDAITTKPTWLSTWTDTGQDIAGNGLTYSLYKKTFSSGAAVSLGNNGNTSLGQYVVVVKPLTSLVSNLTVNDSANSADWSIRANLQAGDLTYGDRTVVFSAVAPSVTGKTWIRPAMDSKAYTGTTLVSFTVNSNANVYVAHNDAITTKPSWLSTWTDTGADLTSNGLTYSLFRKAYTSGSTVSLGNNGDTSLGQYVIAIE